MSFKFKQRFLFIFFAIIFLLGNALGNEITLVIGNSNSDSLSHSEKSLLESLSEVGYSDVGIRTSSEIDTSDFSVSKLIITTANIFSSEKLNEIMENGTSILLLREAMKVIGNYGYGDYSFPLTIKSTDNVLKGYGIGLSYFFDLNYLPQGVLNLDSGWQEILSLDSGWQNPLGFVENFSVTVVATKVTDNARALASSLHVNFDDLNDRGKDLFRRNLNWLLGKSVVDNKKIDDNKVVIIVNDVNDENPYLGREEDSLRTLVLNYGFSVDELVYVSASVANIVDFSKSKILISPFHQLEYDKVKVELKNRVPILFMYGGAGSIGSSLIQTTRRSFFKVYSAEHVLEGFGDSIGFAVSDFEFHPYQGIGELNLGWKKLAYWSFFGSDRSALASYSVDSSRGIAFTASAQDLNAKGRDLFNRSLNWLLNKPVNFSELFIDTNLFNHNASNQADTIFSISMHNTGNIDLEISSVMMSDPWVSIANQLPITILPNDSVRVNFLFHDNFINKDSVTATIDLITNSINTPVKKLYINYYKWNDVFSELFIDTNLFNHNASNQADTIFSISMHNTGNIDLEISSVMMSDPWVSIANQLPITILPNDSVRVNFLFHDNFINKDSVTATIDLITNSINTPVKKLYINYYKWNDVNTFILVENKFTSSFSSNLIVDIYDIMGKRVLTLYPKNKGELKMALKQLNKGIYLINYKIKDINVINIIYL